MDAIISGFLDRTVPAFKDCFDISLTGDICDQYRVTTANGRVLIQANNHISACQGFYDYLKKYCNVQLSWCGNRSIRIKELVMFEGTLEKKTEQKYRVYMNYCTLAYSMCWWDFERWEKEIDFMAMNGVNMPLAVVGSEAVWYETLLEFGFPKEEALQSVSGPAFWPWQLMTNIEGYLPPQDETYIYERLALGRKILNRYREFGMHPIQQGFSGHVPMKLAEKFPHANILKQKGWCLYPKTAQLDPLDPLFAKFGAVYLNRLDQLLGNCHYLACDPFHEGKPPKPWKSYLSAVGKAIDRLYADFDPNSVWVMQAWTMREQIVRAVPKNRLLLLDLNSEKTMRNQNMWGYPVVCGMLHNFGGKNAMQGKLKQHCENSYLKLKRNGANVAGTGMFMEGIEQNPVLYDLQFELLTASEEIDFSRWLDQYIERRYGRYDPTLRKAWELLLETCYRSDGYEENAVGSTLAARPQLTPVKTGPCCFAAVYYDTKRFEKAVACFLSVSDAFQDSDGYQYDLCDLVRQAMSNRFFNGQKAFADAYQKKDLQAAEAISGRQLELLLDLDGLLAHRSEMCLSRWICDSHALASGERERRYFDHQARTLITLWGDVRGSTAMLYDYAWREWSGLIKEYYSVRWSLFYEQAIAHLKSHTRFRILNGNSYFGRRWYRSYRFGRRLNAFELEWGRTYSEYARPSDTDVVPAAKECVKKWGLTGAP